MFIIKLGRVCPTDSTLILVVVSSGREIELPIESLAWQCASNLFIGYEPNIFVESDSNFCFVQMIYEYLLMGEDHES